MNNKERIARNLDPHRPAKCAMWLYSEEYSKSGIGSMDFWDTLGKYEKNLCREMANQIVTTRPEINE